MTTKTRKPTAPKAAPVSPTKADVEVTSVSSWKKQKEGTPLTLPSGNVIRIRNASFQTFMRVGIIPNSLMAVVQSAIDKGKEPAMGELTGNEGQLNDMVKMVDDVVCFVSLDPKIHPLPKNDDDERDEDLLYVDEVDDEDKMFIFGVGTGGTRDVETFRRESANSVAAVQRG